MTDVYGSWSPIVMQASNQNIYLTPEYLWDTHTLIREPEDSGYQIGIVRCQRMLTTLKGVLVFYTYAPTLT